ncbi:hypothetical protein QZH41_003648 [Actinostola sp. cb2023]|nr:hypothetical protein QZH41_003648 [Actinostola sp. cb2023]
MFDIICDEAKKYIPLTKTIFYAGKLVGAYLFGWISDRYGRRVTLLSTMFIQFVASLIQSFSVNFTMYVILRVPLGICSGGTLIAAFALMAEMVSPDKRNWANTLVQSSYGVGIALQALLAYFVRDWKPFSLCITIPNVLFVLYFWLVVSGVYYGLSFNSGNLSGNFYLNFAASGLVEIPAYIIAGYLVDSKDTPLPSSKDTPLTSSMGTPLTSSKGTPLTSSMGTPLTSSKDTPLPSSKGTPLPSSKDTPLPSSKDTPLTSSMGTPLTSSKGTPLTSSMGTPLTSSKDTPLPSSMGTPLTSSKGTPLTSSMGTPLTSSKDTPLPSSKDTPLTSSKGTPITSSKDTPLTSSKGTPQYGYTSHLQYGYTSHL